MGFLRKLIPDKLQPDPLTIQIWDCRPLVITDADGRIRFSGDAKVEFEPSGDASPLGLACVIEPAYASEWQLILLSRQVVGTDLRLGVRDGVILSGEDGAGNGMRWLIGGPAIDRLTQTSDPSASATAVYQEVWECSEVVVTHNRDGEVYRGQTRITCERPASGEGSVHLTVQTGTDEDWFPDLWIESEETKPGGLILAGFDSEDNSFTWEVWFSA